MRSKDVLVSFVESCFWRDFGTSNESFGLLSVCVCIFE